ncbi:MAG: two-component regulator propeller domain-containing protein [Flavobacteriales bacterium]
MSTILLFSILNIFTSCSGQNSSQVDTSAINEQKDSQIAEYVVEIFEDSKGNLWFGTIPNGAAKYDGKALTYFTTEDGLIGNTVTSFAEDKEGNIWLGTHSGLSKYDGKTFTNFTDKDGLVNNRVSELLIDKKGNIWIGTWGGVSRFNGTTFSDFSIPTPHVELLPYQTTMNWITEIMEDKEENIWFGRDGYGVCKYNGQSFTHFTKKDGLVSNNIQEILEDRNGNIWVGSRVVERDNPDTTGRTGDGGLCEFDGKKFTRFDKIKGLSKNETYALYEDSKGNIWIGANGLGAYRYDGKDFTLFSKTDRADLMPYGYGIQNILEDRKGNVWLGLSGGLFRISGDSIINVSQKGLAAVLLIHK